MQRIISKRLAAVAAMVAMVLAIAVPKKPLSCTGQEAGLESQTPGR